MTSDVCEDIELLLAGLWMKFVKHRAYEDLGHTFDRHVKRRRAAQQINLSTKLVVSSLQVRRVPEQRRQ